MPKKETKKRLERKPVQQERRVSRAAVKAAAKRSVTKRAAARPVSAKKKPVPDLADASRRNRTMTSQPDLEASRAAGRKLAPTSERLRALRDKQASAPLQPAKHEVLVARALEAMKAVSMDATVAVEQRIRSLESLRSEVNARLADEQKERASLLTGA